MISHMLVILPKDKEHYVLYPSTFENGCLGYDQLLLLTRKASFAQEAPSLHWAWQADLVIFQPPVALIVIGDILQQGLARLTLQYGEVAVKVLG